ncbi:MAG: hypothetical protein IV088_15400 [Hydrogenophaga sp.]|uniref:hypothetical protein n=1 Tax=Hydrogenophaga sp. TaxID=1904254 RepID=UPI0025C41AA0|nr:hypothetical protein [Hydrogenophaga sp.]MBT9552234.1 hypothetical protein [Hydrogenophaga sp.]
MTLLKKEISPSHRRQVFRIGTGLGLGALLAACGGGGGGSDSDDSRDLRAALDRLVAGMTEDEITAAVGWPPNDGPLAWDNGSEYLTVVTAPIGSNTKVTITSATYWVKGVSGGKIVRNFI